MDDRSKAPFAAQDPQEVGRIVNDLKTYAQKGKAARGFSIKKKTYTIADGSGRAVDSWMMQDWDYKKPNLPIYARGLFTHTNNGRPEIAVRGYDKFFNTEEVNATRWRNIENSTRGPYELSVKENGCIIFIAGLDDHTLLVTSKHSTGPRQDASANHAFAGEAWIDKQLAALGRTRADLAKRLRLMNATAVAELCDDQFEEHVLEYTPDQAGLYLHGINLNTPQFATYPGNLVGDFAEEWGFRKTMYVMKNSLDEVKAFLEDVAQTGNYAGRDTEGFVIRCQSQESGRWQDWFFKYKFEEPYLMYRQWREVTKAIIAGKPPKFRKHQRITEEYMFYARQQLAKDPAIGKAFNNNHGIIKMRTGFLEQKGMRGDEIIRRELESDGPDRAVTEGVVLCPAATIGCGKTTVALALVKLFGWGHEQNDNIEGKGRRPQRFASAVVASLASHPVVIADRNNHQRREREQIIKDIRATVSDAKMVCLHWVHDRGNYEDIRQTMQDRVLNRGDNHQTIQAGSKDRNEIVGIMDGFLSRFEPVDVDKAPDDEFDHVIDLDVAADSRANLATLVNALHDEYPKLFNKPSDDDMDAAIEWALSYKPSVKHDLSKNFGGGGGGSKKDQKQSGKENGSAKTPRPEFFYVSVPAPRINSILDAIFRELPAEQQHFYTQLKATRRVQPSFHVTLIHRLGAQENNIYWQRLREDYASRFNQVRSETGSDPAPSAVEIAKARVQLESVVWDGRVMGILARLPDADGPGGYPTTNRFAHVTIGTAADNIKPRETNDLLAAWHDGTNGRIQDVKIKGNVIMDGAVKVSMSR